jgi:hypothetical protein
MQNIVQVKLTYGIDTDPIPNIFHFNFEAWLNAKKMAKFSLYKII